MLAEIATAGMQDVIQYTGSIVGHSITVYMSNGPIGAYDEDDEIQCRWTIQIPSLGVDEIIEIDHTTVTCLGVPAISISSVAAFDDCVGTISLFNYSTVKVPFHVRDFGDSEEGLTVPFPDGYALYGCDTLPRFICITKKHNHENRVRSPRVSWEIEWWRGFEWDSTFEPYNDPDEDEDIIGRWRHVPKDATAFIQHLYLIQDSDGNVWLQPDFNSPGGTNGDGEDYQRVPLSSCGCDFKILDVRPVDDPSPPELPGQSLSTDLLGIDYRGGRCGCWDYFCGKRRCVPRYLCGFVFVGGAIYRNILFTWSNSTKCWASSGGVDLDDVDMPFDLSICLRQNDEGECELYVTHEDYNLNPVSVGSIETVFAGTFEGTNYGGDDYFSLNVTTSFDGDCELLLTCVTATPCADDCGSHPPILNLRLRGWSTAMDIPPGPRECETEITLVYQQAVVVSGSGILITCQYVGFVIVDSSHFDIPSGMIVRRLFLIKAVLSMGSVTITRRYASDPETILQTETAVFSTETCDPYYAYYFTLASLKNCFFGDSAIFFHRWEAEVTE